MRKRWSRVFALSLGVPLLVMLLAACGAGTTGSGGSASTSTGSTVLKIATDYPTSGSDASAGKPSENGAHLAVDQANAEKLVPGITFEFVPKDDVGPSGTHDPSTGQKNVADLIGDGLVVGMVVHLIVVWRRPNCQRPIMRVFPLLALPIPMTA